LRSRSPQVFFAASVWPGGRLHLRGSNDQNLWMALGGNVKERTLPRKI